MVKKQSLVILMAVSVLVSFASLSFGETSLPKKKQTSTGFYITAKEAYNKWLSNPGNIKIVDCRTPEEYIFVGHAPMAYNIPSKLVTHKVDFNKNKPVMKDNPSFVSLVKEKFEQTDTIMIICRSGVRSAVSANKLAEAGFKKVYTITDGFEGDKVIDPDSIFYGKRFKNGWKNAGNPWTYELDNNLIYVADAK